MPPRPYLNQRSKGSSQAASRGNELDGRGRAPRNRGTSDAIDSPNDRSNGSISTPEQTHNTSAQSQEASNERQPGIRSDIERNGLRDLGNRKRKLNQAITEVLISSFKKLKSEYVFLGYLIPNYPSSFTAQTRMCMIFIAPHAASLDS